MTDVMTTHAGSTVTRSDLDQSIGMLRALVSLTSDPSADKLQSVLALTAQGYGPSTIAQETGLSREELVDAIKGIGQRFRSRGDDDPDVYGTALFPLEPDPETIASMTKKRREATLEKVAQMRAENPLPYSWQLEFPEKGVRKAVAAIRSKTEVDQDLKALALRVTASQTPPSSGLLTFPALRATWMLIQLGQLHRFACDTDLPLRAAQTVVAAYEALETARVDSVTAMLKLRGNPDPKEIDSLAVRARPLAEAAVRRLEQILASTRKREDLGTFKTRGMNLFLNETEHLEMPAHVGELNEGQVHRIGLMLGLQTDPVPDRELGAAETRLRELGLEDDIPWLRGVWISAFSCKRENDFWKAIEQLNNGDTNWASSLK